MNPTACPRGLPRTPHGAQFGDLVVARAWKYNGAPHWVVPGFLLGEDEHGYWLYQPRGCLVARPGRAHLAGCQALCLIPHEGNWLGTFYDDPHEPVDLYLDLSTAIGWQQLPSGGWEVNSIDMDLDVIRPHRGAAYIDDEDEFAEHARQMHYPRNLQRELREDAADLLERVGRDDAPFDIAFRAQWLARAGRLPLITLDTAKDQ